MSRVSLTSICGNQGPLQCLLGSVHATTLQERSRALIDAGRNVDLVCTDLPIRASPRADADLVEAALHDLRLPVRAPGAEVLEADTSRRQESRGGRRARSPFAVS